MLWLETGQRAGQRRLKGWTSNKRLERVQKDDHCSRESQQVCSTRSKMSSTWRRADETPSSVPLEFFMSFLVTGRASLLSLVSLFWRKLR